MMRASGATRAIAPAASREYRYSEDASPGIWVGSAGANSGRYSSSVSGSGTRCLTRGRRSAAK